MALRVCKAVLVFAIALFYTILVLNNITDYGSNYEYVRHVLMMDSTLPGNHLMWRAVDSPLVHTVFYIGIIAWESVTMLLCWWAGVRLLKSYRADRAQFAAAVNVAMIALTTSLLMWLVAFLDVGGEWFLMWQSKMWNGQEEAFRMFTIVGVVLLVVVQREPTPVAKWIGHQDNNVAEYIALLEALQCALGLKAISANLKEEVTRTHLMFVVAVVGMMTPGYSPRRRKHSV